MKRLLLVDGSNMVMRAAFGGKETPERSAGIASGLIHRAAQQIGATHLILALDHPDPSWRKLEFAEYKAHRTNDTRPWLDAAAAEWKWIGWHVERVSGFEADDILATVAKRAAAVCPVTVLSSDSDLLPLLACGVQVLKPCNGGVFQLQTVAAVCERYEIAAPALLPEYKALTGETGDNVPGVPGIGPVKAARLLKAHGTLEAIIQAGGEKVCPASALVAEHAAIARRALKLLSLSFDAPCAPIQPRSCIYK